MSFGFLVAPAPDVLKRQLAQMQDGRIRAARGQPARPRPNRIAPAQHPSKFLKVTVLWLENILANHLPHTPAPTGKS